MLNETRATEELGYIVRAELADEDIDDYLYVAEDQDGDLEVLHFYRNGLYLVPNRRNLLL